MGKGPEPIDPAPVFSPQGPCCSHPGCHPCTLLLSPLHLAPYRRYPHLSDGVEPEHLVDEHLEILKLLHRHVVRSAVLKPTEQSILMWPCQDLAGGGRQTPISAACLRICMLSLEIPSSPVRQGVTRQAVPMASLALCFSALELRHSQIYIQVRVWGPNSPTPIDTKKSENN